MANHEFPLHYHTLLYLGAGAKLPLEACAATADHVWLVEGSLLQAARLERAAAAHPNLHVEIAVVDHEARPVTFQEYNLTWASGITEPDASVRRLYPGLRCLHSEVRQSININSLVERCLEETKADGEANAALLVIDLGQQAEDLLAALSEGGNLSRFACVAVVPPHRRPVSLLPPEELHGPLPLPASLAWLSEGSRCFLPHPLLARTRTLTEKSTYLAQRLAGLEESHGKLINECRALAEERDTLRAQLETQTQEREEEARRHESLASENQELRLKLEAVIRERDELRHKGEELGRQRDELERRAKELAEEREDALHQNHLNHVALKEERALTAQLTEARAHLAAELEERSQERDHQRQKYEKVIQELNALKEQLDRLAKERQKALNQHHLTHVALKEEQERTARLKEERDRLAQHLEAARRREEEQHNQLQEEQALRQQLVEQEMLKAEAQLELVRDILTHGKDL